MALTVLLNKQDEIWSNLQQLHHLEQKILFALHVESLDKSTQILEQVQEAHEADCIIALNLQTLGKDFQKSLG